MVQTSAISILERNRTLHWPADPHGHYGDVVPVEASAAKLWTAQPFGGEIKADTVWGRGVSR